MKIREVGIDFLKIISILGVMALHTQRSLATGICYNPILYYLGRFGMPVFFMVNGYLILKRDKFDFDYWKKKTFNIVRILVIWGVINSGYYAIFHGQTGISQLIRNAGKSVLARGIVPFWFLITFVILYSLILLIRLDWIKKNITTIIFLLGAVCVLFDIASFVSIIGGGYFVQNYIPQPYRLWTWSFYFCFGYWLSLKKFKPNWIVLCGVSIMAVFYQYILCDVLLGKINSEYCYDSIIMMIWAAILFVQFRGIEYPDDCKTTISFISANTFGVFLLHQYFLDMFDFTNAVNSVAGGFLLWAGLSVGCFILSVACGKIPFVNKAFTY